MKNDLAIHKREITTKYRVSIKTEATLRNEAVTEAEPSCGRLI